MSMACPACAGMPPPQAAPGDRAPTHVLHLPDIHCAGCIAGVETALMARSGVQEARVNLTLKRVFVSAPGLAATDLVETLAQAGHRAQRLDAARMGGEERAARDLLMRIGVAGFAMMNVMLLSVAVWSGAAGATEKLFHLISAAIALPAVAYSARPFFASALGALRGGRLNMDVPISLAIMLATAVSLATALGFGDQSGWFDAALALTFFLLVGRYLDRAGRASARSAAAELAALEAPQALLIEGGTERIVDADNLAAGDLIRVRPGDRIPADGTILSGRTDLDRSALTGESAPESAGVGDSVAAGETCLTGALEVRVDRAGRETGLARMAELVATAETQRTRYTGLADRAARIYAPAVHLLGAGAFVAWLWATGDGWRSLDVAISVLVITCPCALGLAIPAVSTIATGRLFRAGLLVTSRTALERLSEVDLVVFDKTGTLTSGTPVLEGMPNPVDLAVAAGLAQSSNHPVSRAIVAAAKERGIEPRVPDHPAEKAGQGVEGLLGGRPVRLGRKEWIGAKGDAAVWLRLGDAPPVPFTTRETLRDEAADTIATLRSDGYEVALLSGDTASAVARIAATLDIDRAEAGMTPEQKVAWVEDAARQGRKVLMVGDGLNDTGCLAVAHAGIAPGSGLDAARSASDVVLLSGGLPGVVKALRTARQSAARMRQNIGLAAAYNAVSIPVALLGLASPVLAALAMSTSSLTVSANAMRRMR
ncbi:heavy metal translocating P-type ATPase [Palleronia abyssalis]|uniref:Putative copper-exporting P-type ATPase V n=1 Tax=Palleronia abyssalis TaxID=1501240 RepID=A0A2R8BRT8_9RHOB|nr:heavy metal translocating P-type ATPase [Palleronia abyssalis]SPJ22870.1 putative copper-exporting P-type ATPase V [Palleronia abyssalis]